MRWIWERDSQNDTIRYTVEITSQDLEEARLTAFDRRLIHECEGSSRVSDKLLALETLARRIEDLEEASQPEEGSNG